MLFDPRAHEPLADEAWDPAAAAEEIRAIARDADAGLRGDAWWPLHPLDAEPGDPEVFHGVYLGAAGVLWALDRLARDGLHEPGRDYARLALDALDSYLRRPEFAGSPGSLWIGEAGITLVAWLLSPAAALADRLLELVALDDPADTLELMWGSPGRLVIAGAMPDPRFAPAAAALADRLMARWGENVPGFWTQRLYGETIEYLGPAHGLAGVVVALRRHLRPDLVDGVTDVLARTAIQEGACANWPPSLQSPLVHRTGTIRTQWCHGAPGIVASLAALPRAEPLDSLLIAGGELAWAAGPLRKGAGLCHGTAGNGFAFLKLLTRTGDERWLERARRFAMHASHQTAAARSRHGHGRHTLWTGDLGTALYLRQCLAAGSDLPTLDSW
jgi:hypothetical protein